jgi:hypothetical protein
MNWSATSPRPSPPINWRRGSPQSPAIRKAAPRTSSGSGSQCTNRDSGNSLPEGEGLHRPISWIAVDACTNHALLRGCDEGGSVSRMRCSSKAPALADKNHLSFSAE